MKKNGTVLNHDRSAIKNRIKTHCCFARKAIQFYSTVTDFARFLGLSTSQPLPTAT